MMGLLRSTRMWQVIMSVVLSSVLCSAVPQFQQTNTFVDPRGFVNPAGARLPGGSALDASHFFPSAAAHEPDFHKQDPGRSQHQQPASGFDAALESFGRTPHQHQSAGSFSDNLTPPVGATRSRVKTGDARASRKKQQQQQQQQFADQQHGARFSEDAVQVTPLQGPIAIKNGSMPVIPLYSYPAVLNGTFYQIPVSTSSLYHLRPIFVLSSYTKTI
jgi:hypothetical protein